METLGKGKYNALLPQVSILNIHFIESTSKPSIAPKYRFISTLRQMVDTESNHHIIRWNQPTEDTGFTIMDISSLDSLLQKYF